MKQTSYFVLMIVALLLSLPLQAQQKKKPAETSKPAATKPKSAPAKEPEAYGYLLVSTDMDVNVRVNFGKTYRVLTSERGRRVPLEKGDNVVEIIPADGSGDGYTETFSISNTGNKFYEIKLKAQRDTENARKAEETRKAEEARLAEQRQKEEEARLPSNINDPLAGTLLLVKGGDFTMGCTSEQSDCSSNESPTHSVTLSNFYLGKTEVTQAQWRAVMGNNPSRFSGCNKCPVDQVSWEDVQEFLSRLNSRSGGARYRLPTEPEWEYAARGGNQSRGYQYAGSHYLDEVAWYDSNSGSKTHPVKGKKANELGLYDMSGNVVEWCSDWYGSYSSGTQTNPSGPSSGSDRVLRGGSGYGDPQYCRVALRGFSTPSDRYGDVGFRLARTP